MKKTFPKVLKFVLIFVLIFVLLFATIALSPWIVFLGGLIFAPSPGQPEFVYGEFPFSLTYELNGEIIEINDVIICEYNGVVLRDDRGKMRQWNEKLKSGNEKIILLDLSDSSETDELGREILEVYFSYGRAEYYMGETQTSSNPPTTDSIAYLYITSEGTIGGSGYRPEEAYEKFGIRLISWECAPPIENSFE